MSKVSYEMKPVEEKREKTYMKGSIYDPMIDAFIESRHKLVEISVEDKKAAYVVTQLMRRIDVRKLDIIVSAAQNFVYMEHGSPGKVQPKE